MFLILIQWVQSLTDSVGVIFVISGLMPDGFSLFLITVCGSKHCCMKHFHSHCSTTALDQSNGLVLRGPSSSSSFSPACFISVLKHIKHASETLESAKRTACWLTEYLHIRTQKHPHKLQQTHPLCHRGGLSMILHAHGCYGNTTNWAASREGARQRENRERERDLGLLSLLPTHIFHID